MTASVTDGGSRDVPPPTLVADVGAMRAVADRLLTPGGTVPAVEELPALIHRLREHIQLLASLVEELIRPLPVDDVPRGCTIYRVGRARQRLRARAQLRHRDDIVHAQGLARSLRSLCDHYEALRERRAVEHDEDRELAAYVRMLYHPHGCPACRPSAPPSSCPVAERLYEAWRQERRSARSAWTEA